MPPRASASSAGRRTRLFIAAVFAAALLFAGHWLTTFLTDRWWAAEVTPAAVPFITQVHLLRLVLELGGILLAVAWFIGHLLVVYRAIGSVQVPRHVANLEFRETVTPGALLGGAVGVGALLGLLAGSGMGDLWPAVALAWHGVTVGLREPLLGHDAGVYAAQLPLWRALHGFALLLALLGLGTVLLLYVLVGAVRWMDGRPALNDHARRHLGWLLAALAACLAWGYLLEPYERVGGIPGPVDAAGFGVVSLVAPALAGVALTTTALSILWAIRPRHALALAGWLILVAASTIGHYIVPAFAGRHEPSVAESPPTRDLARAAWGLEAMRESTFAVADTVITPALSLWGPAVLGGAPEDSTPPVVDPVLLQLGSRPQPAWLVLRGEGAAGTLYALADDRASAAGAPLYLRRGDTLAYPAPNAFDTLSRHAVRPYAASYELDAAARGPVAGGWARRFALAWALQATPLLSDVPLDTRVAWRLSPESRLAAIAPFAQWSAPAAALIDDRLVWLADGYVAARTFPLADTLRWRGELATTVRAGFRGVIDAESGRTRVFLREDGGPIAAAWADLAGGVVEPESALPSAIAGASRYPTELLQVQAKVLAQPPWSAGVPAGTDSARRAAPPGTAWRGASAPSLTIAFDQPREPRLSAVLEGRGDGTLLLTRIDSAVGLPAAAMLTTRWHRFVTFEQLRDSVAAAGARLETGPVRLWLGPRGLGAYEVAYVRRHGAQPAVVWVSVASGSRLGAGRNAVEAWANLRGASAPLPPGIVRGQLDEARRWVRRADSALHRGDLPGFGRAFDALKDVLGADSLAH